MDVETVHPIDGDQRCLDQLLMHLVREVGLQRASVEVELAAAGKQTHPHHGLLAAADGLDRAVEDHRLAPRSGRRLLARVGLSGGVGRLCRGCRGLDRLGGRLWGRLCGRLWGRLWGR